MLKIALRLLGALAVIGLLMTTGCALDPMERLSEQIDAQDIKVRETAILDLANLRDDRAIESLVTVLEGEEKPAVYDMAGVALVKQGREVVTDKKPDPIITMVGNVMKNVHLPVGTRCRAAWVLGEIGDREAIPLLRAGAAALDAAGAAATEVQAQATLGLKKLGDASVGEPFELAMGLFKEGVKVDTLPSVKSVTPAEAEEADATAVPAAKKPAAKPGPKPPAKPGLPKKNIADKSA